MPTLGLEEGHRKESGNHRLVSLNGKKPQQWHKASPVGGPPETGQGIWMVPQRQGGEQEGGATDARAWPGSRRQPLGLGLRDP